MSDLIYLIDDFDSTVERILSDKELSDCELTKENIEKTLISFQGDEIACSVFLKKYALRDENNKILEFTLEESKDRWAKAIAEIEKKFSKKYAKDEKYFRELYDYFLPGGRQMFSLGNKYTKKTTLTNCYVTSIEEDSIEGIFETAKKIARTYSYGGGVGFCIGNLRPKSAKVSNTAKHSTGSVSFMELFSMTTGLIGQSGRRGALMITIPVDHPDIEDFIEIKHNNIDKVKHANISIKITNEFMQAVLDDKDFTLKFETKHEKIEKTISARYLWKKIIQSSRDSSEPGILFWENITEDSPTDTYDQLKVSCTNPCVTGDTLVYVADGREPISIKQLAEEGNDVPVFCFGDRTSVRMGRFPRKTRELVPVIRIYLNDGSSFCCTKDHMLYAIDNHIIIKKSAESCYPGTKLLSISYQHEMLVDRIEDAGFEDVYNITVDDFHNYGVVTKSSLKSGIYVGNCGEIPLGVGNPCVLGSIILHEFVDDLFSPNAKFDFDLFKSIISRAIRHLDDVVEFNLDHHPLLEQKEASRLGRRIGLGITGLADTFAALNIKYDSKEAIDFVEKIMKIKMEEEYKSSIMLAKERGPFPLFDPTKHYERGFCARLPEKIKELGKKYGQRNSGISTIAPNGSLSIIAQCSSGIEPIFALQYKRFVEMGSSVRKEFIIRHQGVSRFKNVAGDMDLPECWITAHQIDYKSRIKLQGALQKYIDASISSTINLPRDVDSATVGQIYIDAWKEKLKGVTVYREGSREGILVTDEFAKLAGEADMNTMVKCVRAEGGDKFYIMTSYKDKDIKNPYQIFVLNYKQGERDSFVKISNSLIKMLRDKEVPEERIEKYINRSKDSLTKLTRFLSLSMKTENLEDAVKILDEHAFAGTLASRLHEILSHSLNVKKAVCKNCHSSNVRMEEGCVICLDCNTSGCGG
jgi:ribonucleoside-diphosphate reductase alpha chain